jgi:hypothetical protein
MALFFEFEASSHAPGKISVDIGDLWTINSLVPLGEWLFNIEYVLFWNREVTSSTHFLIQSPQILSANNEPLCLAIIDKKNSNTFFGFNPLEKARRFERTITNKTAKIDLNLVKIQRNDVTNVFEADVKVRVSIKVPYV